MSYKQHKFKSLIPTIIIIGSFILAELFEDSFMGPVFFLIALSSLVWSTVSWVRNRQKRETSVGLDIPNLSKTKEDHYRELGMSSSEIDYFRHTMAETKQQIQVLEKNMTDVTKLRTIDLKCQTLKATKAIFKELVKEPKKLHQANDFLYTHLPNIAELTERYVEINDHDIKNKQTYDALTECAKAIEDLSQLIVLDYNQLVKDDLDDLDVELKVAKQTAERTVSDTEYKGDNN
ncbi:5-bromo-4-chloroindolyl phosphate hydrolysis family protein [Vagococcus vulneris]|uniref:5-bromo-4-chloroindolyl phosphate hydrolysis protein n=1 Tax=Vagococcus vulneris TaxID=1977869 RepID=A0A429ZWL2_9ENTE|nr:5-bromo-4-chloroindolyl phosphate hydrolysis family protein [Vagococcus vulneris]RST98193.1 hypothetical protein CBF37_08470 [Vagococcus vulneris]